MARRFERAGRAFRATFAACIIGLGVAACTSIGGPSQSVTSVAVDARHAAGAISAYRQERGLGRVTVDSRLMAAASDYARAMGSRDRINHRIGGSLGSRVSRVGYEWGAAAENLAAGQANLDAALADWKNSAGHRANLLNPRVTEMGIAAAATPAGRNYWALILAGPPPERTMAGPFALGFGQ